MSDATRILQAIEQGDPHAAEQLLPLVYEELRKLAAAKLAHEKPGQTLQATALVHEAYIRLVDQTAQQRWDGSRHFFAAAAEAMRRILIERARQKQSLKAAATTSESNSTPSNRPCCRWPATICSAWTRHSRSWSRRTPAKPQLVKLRFFAGLTTAQAAEALGVSVSTAENDWTYARSWLRLEMQGGRERGTNS